VSLLIMNKEQGTRNKEQGTRNKEQGTRNKEQGRKGVMEENVIREKSFQFAVRIVRLLLYLVT